MTPSPRPWTINGHSIEANDECLWQQNDRTGRGVVALLPSAPKSRFSKKDRKEWDDLTEANADLIITAVNSFKGKRNLDRFNSGDPIHDADCAVGTYCAETADSTTGEPEMLIAKFARWLFASEKREKENPEKENLKGNISR